MKNDFIKTKAAANMFESTQLTMHTVPKCHLLLDQDLWVNPDGDSTI